MAAYGTITWGHGTSSNISYTFTVGSYPADGTYIPSKVEKKPLVEMEQNKDQLRIKDY